MHMQAGVLEVCQSRAWYDVIWWYPGNNICKACSVVPSSCNSDKKVHVKHPPISYIPDLHGLSVSYAKNLIALLLSTSYLLLKDATRT